MHLVKYHLRFNMNIFTRFINTRLLCFCSSLSFDLDNKNNNMYITTKYIHLHNILVKSLAIISYEMDKACSCLFSPSNKD